MEDGEAERLIPILKAELDARRPISTEALGSLDAWYDVKLTYASNAIEGNTLTHSETQIVVEKGITIGGKTVREHFEAVDLFEATRAIRGMAANDSPTTEDDVLRLHTMVMRRSGPGHAGRYADAGRRVTGSDIVFPAPGKVPRFMEALGKRLEGMTGWVGAAEAHFDLVTIHPFNDGNGRTARLLQNLMLLKAGYPPILIGPEERLRYIEAINRRQRAEPLAHGIVDEVSRRAYRGFMARRLVASLKDHLEGIGVDFDGQGGGPPAGPDADVLATTEMPAARGDAGRSTAIHPVIPKARPGRGMLD